MSASVHVHGKAGRKTAHKRSYMLAVHLKIFTACAQIDCVFCSVAPQMRDHMGLPPHTHTHLHTRAPHHLFNCLFLITLALNPPPCCIASINKPPEKSDFVFHHGLFLLVEKFNAHPLSAVCLVFVFICVHLVNTEGNLE